jgi:hypothetical protein
MPARIRGAVGFVTGVLQYLEFAERASVDTFRTRGRHGVDSNVAAGLVLFDGTIRAVAMSMPPPLRGIGRHRLIINS